MTAADAASLMTTGDIARHLGRALHKVDYAIKSRQIKPLRRAGNLRLFGPDQVAEIDHALGEIDRQVESSGDVTSAASSLSEHQTHTSSATAVKARATDSDDAREVAASRASVAPAKADGDALAGPDATPLAEGSADSPPKTLPKTPKALASERSVAGVSRGSGVFPSPHAFSPPSSASNQHAGAEALTTRPERTLQTRDNDAPPLRETG